MNNTPIRSHSSANAGSSATKPQPTHAASARLARSARFATLRPIDAEKDVDVSVFAMPNKGQAGDLLPNVNRWRRQIGLPEIGVELSYDAGLSALGSSV